MRVALIGAGGWGKNHARVLSQLGVLCAVCDSDVQKAKEFGRRHSVSHYGSVGELLGSEEFDAAVVATPTSTHFDIAARLVGAKKHVLVEKPITYGSGEGQKLVELAGRSGVVLTCGYIERFNPVVGLVKSRVDEKRYGDLIMLEFHRENRMPPHIKDAGVIQDTAVHDIDTANWLFGETPAVVFARAGRINHEHEDFASIMLGYRNEKTAVISSNWVTPKKVRTFSAVCTDAVITSDFISQEIKIRREGEEEEEEAEIRGAERQEPLRLEIESFLGAAAAGGGGGGGPAVEPQQAVNVTRVAEAALLSSQKGIPIYLELK